MTGHAHAVGSLTEAITAAAAVGLLGSLHCAVMCGPLAVAGCTRDDRVRAGELARYLSGRVVSYAAVGALMGHLGHHVAAALSLDAVTTVALGALALAAAWHGVRLIRAGRRDASRAHTVRDTDTGLVPLRAPPARRPVIAWLASLLPRRGLALGLATGVLPCGLLAAGWLLAAGAAHPIGGAAVMVVFSLVTAPGLLAPVAARRLARRWLSRLPVVWYGAAWCALAVWLAARPLLAFAHGGH